MLTDNELNNLIINYDMKIYNDGFSIVLYLINNIYEKFNDNNIIDFSISNDFPDFYNNKNTYFNYIFNNKEKDDDYIIKKIFFNQNDRIKFNKLDFNNKILKVVIQTNNKIKYYYINTLAFYDIYMKSNSNIVNKYYLDDDISIKLSSNEGHILLEYIQKVLNNTNNIQILCYLDLTLDKQYYEYLRDKYEFHDHIYLINEIKYSNFNYNDYYKL